MNNIRKLRMKAGLSQLALTEKFNLTQQSICKYENNQANPDTITAIRMAEFFQVSVEYLVGYSTQKVKEDTHYQIDFTKEEIDLIHKYRTLKPDIRLALNTFINTLSPNTQNQSDDKYFTIITTLPKGGLLWGYKPLLLGQRLKALAFTLGCENSAYAVFSQLRSSHIAFDSSLPLKGVLVLLSLDP